MLFKRAETGSISTPASFDLPSNLAKRVFAKGTRKGSYGTDDYPHAPTVLNESQPPPSGMESSELLRS